MCSAWHYHQMFKTMQLLQTTDRGISHRHYILTQVMLWRWWIRLRGRAINMKGEDTAVTRSRLTSLHTQRQTVIMDNNQQTLYTCKTNAIAIILTGDWKWNAYGHTGDHYMWILELEYNHYHLECIIHFSSITQRAKMQSRPRQHVPRHIQQWANHKTT